VSAGAARLLLVPALAGRVYVPKLYRVAGRGDPLDFIIASVDRSGAKVVYSTTWDLPAIVPAYLGVEAAGGERLGVLCYPFRATQREIKNRPVDEHRVQIRYGSERTWLRKHRLGRDIAGVDVTIVLGAHLDANLFIGLDPFAYDPLPMGISVEFKDADVNATRASGWHVWERVNRAGRRRVRARTTEGLETVLAFAPEKLLDYVRFEREASALGLDPPLRFQLAQTAREAGQPPVGRHALEEQFGLSAPEILDIVERRRRLGVALKGGVAEHHLQRELRADPAVASAEQIDEDGKPDLDVLLRDNGRVLVECKNVSPQRYKDGAMKVEVQKTRSQRADPAGRLYRPDQFDVVAACLFSVTGLWEFRYKAAAALEPSPLFKGRIAPIQRVDESWRGRLVDAVGSA
jgi:hypothetical protein